MLELALPLLPQDLGLKGSTGFWKTLKALLLLLTRIAEAQICCPWGRIAVQYLSVFIATMKDS